MGERFADKYRIETTRMRNWDYGWCGQYFITICTQCRECFFGEIIEGQMKISEIGEIVKSEWLKSPKIRPDMNLELDEYVIMPNHIHGIIKIGENEYNKFDNENIMDRRCSRDAMHGVSTTWDTPKANEDPLKKGINKPGPQRKNLSSIIRGFKSAVTIEARKIISDFGWQSRFYDSVIRDDGSLNSIRTYIINNPKNWTNDELNPEFEKQNE